MEKIKNLFIRDYWDRVARYLKQRVENYRTDVVKVFKETMEERN